MVFGFNLDINEGAFPFDIYASGDWFCIGCPADMQAFAERNGALPPFYRVTDGIRKIHGVHRQGVFAACLNNMNFYRAPFRLADDACSIDQVTDDLISGRRTLENARRFAEEVELVTLPPGAVDVPNPGFHALCADAAGRMLLLEPGNGCAVYQGKRAVLTNFPVLELPADLTDATAGYYGRDRYDTALAMLEDRGDGFSAEDGLKVLEATRQTGRWATRVSFVYACRERTVYYCREGNFRDIRTHTFNPGK